MHSDNTLSRPLAPGWKDSVHLIPSLYIDDPTFTLCNIISTSHRINSQSLENAYTSQKYALEKYSSEKYNLEKYTLEKYTLEKYALEKYALEKYALEKYTLESLYECCVTHIRIEISHIITLDNVVIGLNFSTKLFFIDSVTSLTSIQSHEELKSSKFTTSVRMLVTLN